MTFYINFARQDESVTKMKVNHHLGELELITV